MILAKERLVEYELASQNIHSGREAASVERSELVENRVRVDNGAFVQLEIENASLKSKFAEMEKESFREKTKEKSKVRLIMDCFTRILLEFCFRANQYQLIIFFSLKTNFIIYMLFK